MFFQSRKVRLKNIAKHSFSSIWPRKVKVKKLESFDQNQAKHSFSSILLRKVKVNKLKMFDKNHELNRLKKMQNFNFQISTYLQSRKGFVCQERH